MSSHDLSRLKIDRSSGDSGGSGGRARSPVVVILLAVILAYIGWNEFEKRSGPGLPEVTAVRAVRTGGAPAASGVSANGYVVARTRAALSTDIPGRLVELHVEEGSRVEEGQLIARLDVRELTAARDRAAADLRRAEANLRLAELQLERVRPLVTDGDASQADLDRAEADVDVAKADVAALRAALDEIEVRIDKSSVYAPFSGMVIEKNAEVGEIVSSVSAGTNSRGAVVTVVDFSSLEVQVELAQTSLAAARVGAPVRIVLDAFPDDPYPGRVRQIWPTADRQKATVELRVEFLERDERILPDMGVRATFLEEAETGSVAPRVLIPSSAVRPGPDPAVFILDGGTAVLRRVTIEPVDEPGMVQVLDGLRGAELLIDAPAATLEDGSRVVRKEMER